MNHQLFDEAVEAYSQHCEVTRVIFNQPSFSESKPLREGYILRNNYGFLAKYSQSKGIIPYREAVT